MHTHTHSLNLRDPSLPRHPSTYAQSSVDVHQPQRTQQQHLQQPNVTAVMHDHTAQHHLQQLSVSVAQQDRKKGQSLPPHKAYASQKDSTGHGFGTLPTMKQLDAEDEDGEELRSLEGLQRGLEGKDQGSSKRRGSELQSVRKSDERDASKSEGVLREVARLQKKPRRLNLGRVMM